MHNILIQRQLPADSYAGEFVQICDSDWPARNAFLQQVDDALSAEPSVDGVLHGIRRVHLGKRGIRSTHFPSKKNAPAGMDSMSLVAETRPELTLALMLERDMNVRAFRMQAVTVPLPGNRLTYPDFVVVYTNGSIRVIEVKADKAHLGAETLDKLEQIKLVLHRWGFDYQVVDIKDQPSEREQQNLHWLYRQYRQPPDAAGCKELLLQLQPGDVQRYSYGELKSRCLSAQLPESIVPHLLFVGTLNTQWQKPIDDCAEVWL